MKDDIRGRPWPYPDDDSEHAHQGAEQGEALREGLARLVQGGLIRLTTNPARSTMAITPSALPKGHHWLNLRASGLQEFGSAKGRITEPNASFVRYIDYFGTK